MTTTSSDHDRHDWCAECQLCADAALRIARRQLADRVIENERDLDTLANYIVALHAIRIKELAVVAAAKAHTVAREAHDAVLFAKCSRTARDTRTSGATLTVLQRTWGALVRAVDALEGT